MKNIIIGIVANINKDTPIAHYGNVAYVDAINKAGATAIILPVSIDEEVVDNYIELCDGFLFTGGKDLNPLTYQEDLNPKCGKFSDLLDEYQLMLIDKVFRAKKPILGVCRGLQLLNVYMGGSLYQDVSEKSAFVLGHNQASDDGDVCHNIYISEGNVLHDLYGDKIAVNSFHHQAIHKLADGLKAVASSNDGIIEAVSVENYPYGLAVQWHPEKMLLKDNQMLKLFNSFVNACGGRKC